MAISINSSSRINGSTRIGPLKTIPSTVEYLVVAGGGGGGTYAAYVGGAGGSGIVIIRHSDAFATATVTGSPIVASAGGYVVYKFTGSGTIRWS